LGPSSFQQFSDARPEARPPRRPRRCLLKGCERLFTPSCPQARYCSDACRQAARRWRRWQASQRYRASAHGKERRRQQHRRYRQCYRARLTVARRSGGTIDPTPAREGQRPAVPDENFSTRPCARPGCYALLPVRHEHVQQRFCSALCRLALRRVLDREARYRQRRRRWRRQRLQARVHAPDTS
jgi:hypothetical protein